MLTFAFAAALTALFNGHDLKGWIAEGASPAFAVEQEAIQVRGTAFPPHWLRTQREYRNFRLRFEYKLEQWAEAAVILRAPALGRPMQSGIAIYLAHDFHENTTPWVTGAIAGVLPPLQRLPTSYGRWQSADIRLNGPQLSVRIGDKTVQDLNLEQHPELRFRPRAGFIGFPDLGHAWSIRKVEVEDAEGPDDTMRLTPGRDLRGWELRGSGTWAVSNDVITGANGHGILYAPPVLRDFEFSALVRSRQRVNGGIFLRGSPDVRQHRGFEVQVYSPLDAVYPTGSVYGKQRSRITADLEDQWFYLQVSVQGTRVLVRVNGETVADFDGLRGADLQSGRIGLQIHSDRAAIDFRDVRVRPIR